MSIQKRIRLTYSKQGFIRFTSNLDIQKVFERSLRRAGIKLVFSQGFHPQPKIQQASPLPLGFFSKAELVDIWIEEDEDNHISPSHIHPFLPEGISILSVDYVPTNVKSLQSQLLASKYCIVFNNLDEEELFFLKTSEEGELLFRKHNGKQYDVRPLILSVEKQAVCALVKLSNQPNATTRPDHLLRSIGLDPSNCSITRIAILYKQEE